MAMVIEAILTFNLMFVGLVVSDPRKRSVIASLATGFSIGSGAMAGVSQLRACTGWARKNDTILNHVNKILYKF